MDRDHLQYTGYYNPRTNHQPTAGGLKKPHRTQSGATWHPEIWTIPIFVVKPLNREKPPALLGKKTTKLLEKNTMCVFLLC